MFNQHSLEFLFNYFPWILILFWFIYSLMILVSKDLRVAISNIYLLESIPSVFVTLGLFGTFTGITFGLLNFNTHPEQIKSSIQILLEGLKTAMFTSITGIFLSLIFNKIIKVKMGWGQIEISHSAEYSQLKNIANQIEKFTQELGNQQQEALKEALETVLKDFNLTIKEFVNQLVSENFQELKQSVNNLTEWQKQYMEDIQKLQKAYQILLEKHDNFSKKTDEWVNQFDKIAGHSGYLKKVIDEYNSAFSKNGSLTKIIEELDNTIMSLSEASDKYLEVTNEFESATDTLNNTTLTFESVGKKIESTDDSFKETSDRMLQVYNEVASFRTRDAEEVDRMLHSIDSLFKKYIESLEERMENWRNEIGKPN